MPSSTTTTTPLDLTAYKDPVALKKESSVIAILHIVCFTAGVGILNLPKVVAEAGWLSLMLFPLVTVMVDYSSNRTIQCLYSDKKVILKEIRSVDAVEDSIENIVQFKDKNIVQFVDKKVVEDKNAPDLLPCRLKGLPEVGMAAFGKPGYMIVHVFHKIMLLGFCVVFIVLAGDVMQQLFIGSFLHLNHWQCILIITALLSVPILFLKSMKEVVWTSMLGVSASLFLALATIIICSMEVAAGRYGKSQGVTYDWLNWEKMPLTLAGFSFAYCGNFLYPKIEESMRHPEQFPTVIHISITFITVMYFPVATLAYLVYGKVVASPILHNFPQTFMLTFLLLFILIHVLMTLPLPLVMLIMELEERFSIVSSTPLKQETALVKESWLKGYFSIKCRFLLIRFSLLLLISLIACLFYRSFTDMMDFFGAVSNSLFLFIFPNVFYMKLKGFRTISYQELVFNVLIILVGLCTAFIGGWQAGVNLYTNFKPPFSDS